MVQKARIINGFKKSLERWCRIQAGTHGEGVEGSGEVGWGMDRVSRASNKI